MSDVTVALAVAGFLLTLGGIVVAVTRSVEGIRQAAERQIIEVKERERANFTAALTALEDRVRADQETQDRNFGETHKALRQFVTDLEKKVYQVEIWARDTLTLPLADVIKDVRHLKHNFELHQQAAGAMNDDVIRLLKDVERLSKAVNGKH